MKDYTIVIFYSDEDASYVADIPDLPFTTGFGDTPEDALREVKIARDMWLEAAQEEGRPVPQPTYRPHTYDWLEKPLKQLMTTKEASIYLGVSQSRVRQLILSGQLPGEKEGRDLWIKEEDLEKLKDRPVGYPQGRPRAARAQK